MFYGFIGTDNDGLGEDGTRFIIFAALGVVAVTVLNSWAKRRFVKPWQIWIRKLIITLAYIFIGLFVAAILFLSS